MKAVYLNVLSGCREPERFERLVSFLRKQNPDIVGLSELNGWNNNNFSRLRRFKSETGFRYHVFCRSRHGYHIGLFSKKLMDRVVVLNAGFWHGAIIARVAAGGGGYSFAVTHLSPKSENWRVREARLLSKALRKRGKAVLMGDLNALSPSDVKDGGLLLNRFRKAGIKKFGTGMLRVETVPLLLKGGFVDTLRLFSKGPAYSVPTPNNKDFDHAVRARLDYIFVSKGLAKDVRKAGIVKTAVTARLSDHYPVFAELD